MSHTRRVESILAHLGPSGGVTQATSLPNLCATHVEPASLTQRGIRLRDRVAVITGAGSGIGRASALIFARQGAKLILSDIKLETVDETARIIKTEIPDAQVATMAGDVSEQQTNDKLVAEAVKRYGKLHIFYANAGIVGNLGGFDSIDAESFRRTLDVNVVGAFLGVQAAARYMLTQPPELAGSILITSSVAGTRSGAGGVDYSASKAAVTNMVQTMANELAGKNIRVNAVCPGLIETGMTSMLFDNARARKTEGKIGQLNPLRRSGESHEIAALALFLASEESSYINGQALLACGGLSSSLPVVPALLPKKLR